MESMIYGLAMIAATARYMELKAGYAAACDQQRAYARDWIPEYARR